MTRDRVAGAAFAALAVFIAINARGLDFGTLRTPGPGLYPMLLALLILGVSLTIIGATFVRPASADGVRIGGHSAQVIGAILALAFYAVFLPLAGVGVTSVIFLALLFWIGGVRGLPRIATLSLVIGVGADLACRALKIPMPDTAIWHIFLDRT